MLRIVREIVQKHKEIISSRRIDKHRITGIETMGDEILVGYSNCTGRLSNLRAMTQRSIILRVGLPVD